MKSTSANWARFYDNVHILGIPQVKIDKERDTITFCINAAILGPLYLSGINQKNFKSVLDAIKQKLGIDFDNYDFMKTAIIGRVDPVKMVDCQTNDKRNRTVKKLQLLPLSARWRPTSFNTAKNKGVEYKQRSKTGVKVNLYCKDWWLKIADHKRDFEKLGSDVYREMIKESERKVRVEVQLSRVDQRRKHLDGGFDKIGKKTIKRQLRLSECLTSEKRPLLEVLKNAIDYDGRTERILKAGFIGSESYLPEYVLLMLDIGFDQDQIFKRIEMRHKENYYWKDIKTAKYIMELKAAGHFEEGHKHNQYKDEISDFFREISL
jgi:hypothetical protein